MLRIRNASVEDVRLLRTMMVEFAEYQRMREYVTISEETLARDGFGESPRFRTLICEYDGKPAGYALYFDFYSSFEGPVLFLEDLFVRKAFRGHGIGRALMAETAAVALREGYVALRWEVLDWNQPAIAVYQRVGATFQDDRRQVRLEGEALQQLAAGAQLAGKVSNLEHNRMTQ
jgi:GNAT superfamily N-acetyltransferase